MALGNVSIGDQVTIDNLPDVWTMSAIQSIPDPDNGPLYNLGYVAEMFRQDPSGDIITETSVDFDRLSHAAVDHEHSRERDDEHDQYWCDDCGVVLTGANVGRVAARW